MFYCRFCTFTTEKLTHHLHHSKLHSNLNSNLFCGFDHCRKSFKLEISLRSHLARWHNFRSKQAPRSLEPNTISRVANANAKCICTATLCKKEFDSQYDLVKHLKGHIKDGLKIKCPFHCCENVYNKVDSLTSHLSKKHKHSRIIDSLLVTNANSQIEDSFFNQDNVEDVQSCEQGNDDPMVSDSNFREDITNKSSATDLFLLNLAQFFLKLESQFLIPVSTIQYIVSQTCNIHLEGQGVVKDNLALRLHQENIPLDQANEIINQAFSYDPFLKIESTFGTTYARRQFYEKNFPYIKPVRVSLNDKSNKPHFFHYVPIQKTLFHLFNNKSLEDELQGSTVEGDHNVLRDFTDGSVFKQNPFFKKNSNALKLILYQDSFEVVNPLGAAKKKYKILAVYLSIGNLPPHIRSHVNSMQLVALCREKLFNHEKVYGRIVKDLRKIESEGIKLSSGDIITGTVVFIAGDNLGSHSLGGFVENFSSSSYFCRYCLMHRNQFYSEGGAVKTHEKRTIESYDKIVKLIESANNADGVVEDFDPKGIKFNSIFNSLSYYHVCMPGLPPCLGHDVLEGVIAYDLKLCLDYFVKKKWFSYQTINERIDSFKYSKVDRSDKPCTISPSAKKITGGAWQLCTFLRLLPLLIHDKIQDIDDDVWRCVIVLTEIVEVICAPEIHKSCISYLKIIISDYIHLRQKFSIPLRPKHHFLFHYPELILQFGPLMKVWTLRFESKHTFFKRVIRNIKNFINVTKSLSIKHELFQSFVRLGGDIRSQIEMKMNTNFQISLYNEKIQKAIMSIHLPKDIQECNEVTVKGISYQKGDAMFIAQEGYQYNVQVGRIVILLCDDENLFIVFEALETVFRPHLRTYELGKCLRYECLAFNSLPSIERLHIYNLGTFLCVKPNYGLVREHL